MQYIWYKRDYRNVSLIFTYFLKKKCLKKCYEKRDWKNVKVYNTGLLLAFLWHSEFARRYSDLRSTDPKRLKRQDPMSRCNGLRPLRSLGLYIPLETSFPDAALGVCIVRYTATNICNFDYENRRRFDSSVGKRDATTSASIFSSAYLTPELLFPSKYADYSSASHVFVLHRVAIRYLTAGKTEDGNLLFPHTYDVLFMSSGLILEDFKVAARDLPRWYVARSYFHITLLLEENLCATNGDSVRTLVLATRSCRPIFQRFNCVFRGLSPICGFPRFREKSISKLSYIWLHLVAISS